MALTERFMAVATIGSASRENGEHRLAYGDALRDLEEMAKDHGDKFKMGKVEKLYLPTGQPS